MTLSQKLAYKEILTEAVEESERWKKEAHKLYLDALVADIEASDMVEGFRKFDHEMEMMRLNNEIDANLKRMGSLVR